MLEFYDDVAILLNLCTQLVAFVLSGEMAVAYFYAHQPRGFWPIKNHGEEAVLLCFIFLFLSAAGAGPLSVDDWLARRRTGSTPGPQ